VRLLVLSSEFPPGPGGIGTHAHQVSRHLARLGWDVAVVAPQDYAAPSEVAAFNAAQPFRIASVAGSGGRLTRSLRRVAATVSTLRESSPDVILATGTASVRVAACLRRRPPVVAVAHGPDVAPASAVGRRLARAAFGRADVVVCVSEFVRGQFDALGGRVPAVSVITNGADEEMFAPTTPDRARTFRARIGVGDGASLLLTVGTVKESKGQDVVVRGLPRLLERRDVHYVVAGPELEPCRLAALADDLGVADHVHALGRVARPDLVDAYAACDLFVLTSRRTASGEYEGFGIAVAEAALCERAAIVTNGAGLVEAIEPGATALVVPEDDPAGVADAVDSLLGARDRRRAMGAAARRRALAGQTWTHVAARYDALLRHVAAREERCAS
jgi:phosphatidylinositol alpha-1,6-mannosyltransferase